MKINKINFNKLKNKHKHKQNKNSLFNITGFENYFKKMLIITRTKNKIFMDLIFKKLSL